MPKILFAIASCHAWEENGNNQAVRETWFKDVPSCTADGYSTQTIDCFFFQGHGRDVGDLIALNVPDDYLGIIRKTREIHKWAFHHDYDFVFQCWSDTFVNVKQVLVSGFERYDYFGHVHSWPWTGSPYGFISGGDGWWTSKKACEVLALAEPSESPDMDNGAADDLWVGLVLGKAGIKMVNHPDYGNGMTLHGSVHTGGKGTYDKSWMYKTYNDNRR
jgi:hypothetical protein